MVTAVCCMCSEYGMSAGESILALEWSQPKRNPCILPKSDEAQIMTLCAPKCRPMGIEGLRFTLWASLIFPCYLAVSCEMAVFIKDNHTLEICDILFGVTGLQVRICLESQNRL